MTDLVMSLVGSLAFIINITDWQYGRTDQILISSINPSIDLIAGSGTGDNGPDPQRQPIHFDACKHITTSYCSMRTIKSCCKPL